MPDIDRRARIGAFVAGAGLLVLAIFSYAFFSYPSSFPVQTRVRVERGANLDAIASQLDGDHVVRFPLVFQLLVRLASGGTSIKAGDYYFERQLSLLGVWWRLTRGVYGLHPIKITIPEGWTVHQIGKEFEKQGIFSGSDWDAYAASYEGYVFPDTYFFLPDATPESAVAMMQENFDQKVNDALRAEIARQKKTLRDIIIMASLIEKEANGGMEDAPTISGILWKRLDENMGLQVDAALTYVTGRASLDLRQSDLAFDSPYNTYKYRGLPPTPISNPGLDAILAAIYPKASPYFFYLHGLDGKAHFARTFEEHVVNKEKYLR